MINKNDLRKAISSIAISNAKRNTIYKAFSDLDPITKEEFDSVKSDISKVVESMLTKDTVGKANGVASLDSNGSVPIEQLSNIDTTLFLIVRELPTTDIKTNKIYLVPNQDAQGNNIYVEYLYVENVWENLGEFKAEVDLSEYVNKHELAAIESAIQKQIATKANTQDITNAIVELQDKIGNRVVVSGNVTNNPDEEDITTEGDTQQIQVLKLKDRAYDSLNASGKGYKILRKNWQQINGERKNVLTQEMINEPNTIYEIRYDFALKEDITIPTNCVLKFNGGSIKGGNITGHILNSYVIPQWFGAIEGDDVIDGTQNNEAFQNCVNICDNVYVPSGTYIFKQIPQNDKGGSFRIEKNNTKLFSIGGAVLKFEQNDYNGMTFQAGMVIINNCSNIVIDNIVFEGDELVQTDNSDHNGIIYVAESTNVSIQNCKFFNVSKDAIFIYGSKNIKIDNCIMDTIHRDGMVVDSVDGLLVKNVEITNVRDTTHSFAVDIESHYEGRIIKDVVFKDCNFHNIEQGYAIISTSAIVGECLIDGGYYVGIQVNKNSENVKIRNITANNLTAKGKIDISNSVLIEYLNFENGNDENKSSVINNCNIGEFRCSTGAPASASSNYSVYFNNCVFNNIQMRYFPPNKVSFIGCTFQDVIKILQFYSTSSIMMYNCLYKSNLERNKNINITSNDGIEVVGCSFVFSETTQSASNVGAVILNSKKVFFKNNNISMPKNLNKIYMLNVTQNYNNGGTVTLLNNVFSGLKASLFSTYGLNNMTLGQTRVLANNTFKDDYINEDLSPQ